MIIKRDELLDYCVKNNISNYIVQPYLPNGIVYASEIIAKDGNIISRLHFLEKEQSGGITNMDYLFGFSSKILTKKDKWYDLMEKYSKNFINKYKFSGILEIEYYEYNNKLYFLEINPRVSASSRTRDPHDCYPYIDLIVLPYLELFGIYAEKKSCKNISSVDNVKLLSMAWAPFDRIKLKCIIIIFLILLMLYVKYK